MVEDTEPFHNLFSKPKHIRKHFLFNTLPHIKTLHAAGHQEKCNSLHFPETENGRGFDSRSDAFCNHSAKIESESGNVTSFVVSLSQVFVTAVVIAMS